MLILKILPIGFAIMAALMVFGHVHASFFGPDEADMKHNDKALADAQKHLAKAPKPSKQH